MSCKTINVCQPFIVLIGLNRFNAFNVLIQIFNIIIEFYQIDIPIAIKI